MSARDKPIPLVVNLTAIRRDDALLDRLSRDDATAEDRRALAAELAAWRREVRTETDRLLIDTDQALAVMGQRPRRSRRWGAIAAGAALMIVGVALTWVATSNTPGDLLYPLWMWLYGMPPRAPHPPVLFYGGGR